MYSSLSTISEIGIGLAGFAAVAVAIGYRDGQMHEVDRFRLSILLSTTLGTAMLAVMPELQMDMGIKADAAWHYSAIFMITYSLAHIYWNSRAQMRLSVASKTVLNPYIRVFGWIATLCVPVLLMLSLFGFLLWQVDKVYLAALYLYLVLGAIQFLRILTARPSHVEENA